MDIIARFPRLPPLPDEGVPLPSEPAPRQPHGVLPARRDRSPATAAAPHRRPSFPGMSVATLTIVAAVAWTLAAWHDTVRRAAQQRPERIAMQPLPSVQPAATRTTP